MIKAKRAKSELPQQPVPAEQSPAAPAAPRARAWAALGQLNRALLPGGAMLTPHRGGDTRPPRMFSLPSSKCFKDGLAFPQPAWVESHSPLKLCAPHHPRLLGMDLGVFGVTPKQESSPGQPVPDPIPREGPWPELLSRPTRVCAEAQHPNPAH